MNNLQVMNEVKTISSREVAEMMEVRHADLIGKIEIHTTILEKVSERNFSLVDLWQLSSYKDAKGETRKEYQVTKKGCEFLAHKTTGKKGDLFTQTLKWTEQGREMWFLAKDVANWIEHNQVTRMIELVDEDEKLKCLLSTSGQRRN